MSRAGEVEARPPAEIIISVSLHIYSDDCDIYLQSGEYRHRYGIGGEEGDEPKHSIHAALNLQMIKMKVKLFSIFLFLNSL